MQLIFKLIIILNILCLVVGISNNFESESLNDQLGTEETNQLLIEVGKLREKLLQIFRRKDVAQRRQLLDFFADPSLVVSILHTLEVAYWTLPFGFILTPLLNLLRMPNRRSSRNRKSISRQKLIRFQANLRNALTKFQKLQAGKTH